jgi:hypothetical protein
MYESVSNSAYDLIRDLQTSQIGIQFFFQLQM